MRLMREEHREGMTGYSSEGRGWKRAGGNANSPSVLRDVSYAQIPHVSRKFVESRNYIILIVTNAFLPHSYFTEAA
jgi:hypothetical protein